VPSGKCIVIVLLGGLLLLGLRAAIRRGGRKVRPVDPLASILYPGDEDGEDAHRFTVVKRFLPLEGAHNFRDVGGYRTQEGRRVRWGQVFRSDELSELSVADLDLLESLGLRSIIDLRSPREMKGKASRLPAGSIYRHIRLYKREPILEYLPLVLFRRHALPQAMAANYLRLAETRAETFGAALRLLADPQNLPILYHCVAGKDRTGIVAALILSLLGVPEAAVVADYTLSNLGFEHYYTEFVESGRLDHWGVPYEDFRIMFIVQPAWMQNLLAHLHTKYGGVEDYLIHKAGLEPETLARIRQNLLE